MSDIDRAFPAKVTVERMLPLYQGIMCGPYDHRIADVVRSQTAEKRQNQPKYLSSEEKGDASRFAMPAYWVPEQKVKERLGDGQVSALLGVRDITSATNERTVIPALVPQSGVGNTVSIVNTQASSELLEACLASYVFDFVARFKVGGTHLNFFILEQLPVLSPATLDEAFLTANWFRVRVLELTYTAWDMEPFMGTLLASSPEGVSDAPFIWDDERRSWLLAELDAAFFYLYGIQRNDVQYVMESFPIVRRQEESEFGEYRTCNRILQAYDALAEAIETDAPYKSVLDPPPGEGPRHPEGEDSA